MVNGKEPKSSANGTTGDAARKAQIEARRANRGIGAVCDWSGADSGLIREVITLIARNGYAVTFGYTQDVGSYTIRIIGDENAKPIYVRATEEIDVALRELIYIYGD